MSGRRRSMRGRDVPHPARTRAHLDAAIQGRQRKELGARTKNRTAGTNGSWPSSAIEPKRPAIGYLYDDLVDAPAPAPVFGQYPASLIGKLLPWLRCERREILHVCSGCLPKGEGIRVDMRAAALPDILADGRALPLGIDDERWLWHEVWRVVREMGPRLVFLENVPGHLSGTFGRVLGDLAAGGWRVEWDCVPAAAVGAPHERDRLFALAAAPTDSDGDRLQGERRGGVLDRERAARGDDPHGRGGAPPLCHADGQRRQGSRPEETPWVWDGRDESGGGGYGMRLSPCFVEWMMGLPTGWTETGPTESTCSETESCLRQPRVRGERSKRASEASEP